MERGFSRLTPSIESPLPSSPAFRSSKAPRRMRLGWVRPQLLPDENLGQLRGGCGGGGEPGGKEREE